MIICANPSPLNLLYPCSVKSVALHKVNDKRHERKTNEPPIRTN